MRYANRSLPVAAPDGHWPSQLFHFRLGCNNPCAPSCMMIDSPNCRPPIMASATGVDSNPASGSKLHAHAAPNAANATTSQACTINQTPRHVDTAVIAAQSSGAKSVRGLAALTADIIQAYTRTHALPNPLRIGAQAMHEHAEWSLSAICLLQSNRRFSFRAQSMVTRRCSKSGCGIHGRQTSSPTPFAISPSTAE